jgi:hypothetical protein
MKDEKRFTRGYKVKPSVYKKAMSRAKREKGKLANLMENVVLAYAYGLDIKAIKYDAFKNEEIETIAPGTDWPKHISIV